MTRTKTQTQELRRLLERTLQSLARQDNTYFFDPIRALLLAVFACSTVYLVFASLNVDLPFFVFWIVLICLATPVLVRKIATWICLSNSLVVHSELSMSSPQYCKRTPGSSFIHPYQFRTGLRRRERDLLFSTIMGCLSLGLITQRVDAFTLSGVFVVLLTSSFWHANVTKVIYVFEGGELIIMRTNRRLDHRETFCNRIGLKGPQTKVTLSDDLLSISTPASTLLIDLCDLVHPECFVRRVSYLIEKTKVSE